MKINEIRKMPSRRNISVSKTLKVKRKLTYQSAMRRILR